MSKILGLVLFIFGGHAFAIEPPHYFSSGRSGLFVQTMGATCFTFDLGADSLPCNPAYMAKEREKNLKAQIFVGNNISYLNEAVDIAKGRADQQTIQSLFSKRESSELEGTLELAYLAETFGIAYEPFRVTYYSQFRNPALPEVTLFASLEDSARFQVASYTENDLYWGLQVRYLHRQIIASRFFLTDILAENRDVYLTPQDQKYLFFEPGFLYSNDNNSWRPQVSFNLINLGLRNGDTNISDPVPEYHLGAGIAPDVGWGHWGWAIDAGWHRDIDEPIEIFTLGSYYEIGILRLFGSLAKEANGAGFTVNFGHVNLGLSYSAKTEKIDATESISSRRVYFLLGAEI